MAASQKTVTVNNKEYTLQNPGAMWYLETLDRNRDARGILAVSSYSKDLLENVVVDPVVKVDDFDDSLSGLRELVDQIEDFLDT